MTVPDSEMRALMSAAEVGDETYGEDPTTSGFLEHVRGMFRKEAAILMPTTTMANIVAVQRSLARAYSPSGAQGLAVVAGHQSHIGNRERESLESVFGNKVRLLRTTERGAFAAEELRSLLPGFGVVCTELPTLQGNVQSLEELVRLHAFCREHAIRLHCDGARVFQALACLSAEPHEVAQLCDSLSICFAKDLGSFMGSVLLGDREFIEECRALRTQLGGSLRQSGFVTAPLFYALEHQARLTGEVQRLARACAAQLTRRVRTLRLVHEVQTNMICFTLELPSFRSAHLREFLLAERGIKISAKADSATIRLVLFKGHTQNDLEALIAALEAYVANHDSASRGKA